jgi:hypothetical protein
MGTERHAAAAVQLVEEMETERHAAAAVQLVEEMETERHAAAAVQRMEEMETELHTAAGAAQPAAETEDVHHAADVRVEEKVCKTPDQRAVATQRVETEAEQRTVDVQRVERVEEMLKNMLTQMANMTETLASISKQLIAKTELVEQLEAQLEQQSAARGEVQKRCDRGMPTTEASGRKPSNVAGDDVRKSKRRRTRRRKVAVAVAAQSQGGGGMSPVCDVELGSDRETPATPGTMTIKKSWATVAAAHRKEAAQQWNKGAESQSRGGRRRQRARRVKRGEEDGTAAGWRPQRQMQTERLWLARERSFGRSPSEARARWDAERRAWLSHQGRKKRAWLSHKRRMDGMSAAVQSCGSNSSEERVPVPENNELSIAVVRD